MTKNNWVAWYYWPGISSPNIEGEGRLQVLLRDGTFAEADILKNEIGFTKEFGWTPEAGRNMVVAYRFTPKQTERDRTIQKASDYVYSKTLKVPNKEILERLYDAHFLVDPDSDEKKGKAKGSIYLCPHCGKESRMEW